MSLDQNIDALIRPLAQNLSDIVFYQISIFDQGFPLIVLWLVAAAVFFTGYLGFINIRGFKHALNLVRGEHSTAAAPGEITHFQALATAISGTVGVGNIGGVAVAIGIGGPGAAFWLFMAGFLGMSTKFVECTLGVKYRRYNDDGSVSGGPMYYLERYLVDRGSPRAGKFLGSFYALALVIGCFGIGNMFQSNQAYVQIVNITGGQNSIFFDKGWLFGLVLAFAIGAVIIGGIRSIARVASRIVPFMAVLYVLGALLIIGLSAQHVPDAIILIVSSAFEAHSVTGGAVGAMIVGFQRAVFSNEAGIGSASIAHSAVKTDEPVTEGLVSLLEPFIDTVLICTLTSLVIVTTAYPYGLMDSGLVGIELTSAVFAYHLSWSPYALGIAALLFAFSTSIAWAYYGLKGWTYLFGEGAMTQLIFKAMFCAVICLGCMIQLSAVLDFSDAMVFLIAVPNIIGLYLYGPEIKEDLRVYLSKYNSEG
jgi:AGCS family alanine or glycine:cation symporter